MRLRENDMSSSRKKLPNRRRSETFKFTVQGQFGRASHQYYATVGFYNNGRVGEVFIRPRSGKPGTELNIAMLELSTVTSIALQHGASIEELREAMPRNEAQPEGVIGTLFDLITETGIKDAIAKVKE